MSDDLEAMDEFVEGRRHLLAEYEIIVRSALRDDPECAGIRLCPVAYDLRKRTIRPSMTGVPPGRRVHPSGEHYWTPDRRALTELAGRYIECRSRRWDTDAYIVRPMPDDYGAQGAVRRAWPGAFDCEMSIHNGWIDMVIAVAGWLDELGELPRFSQIKEKFGGLRLYYDGRISEGADMIVSIAEHLSDHICEVCGAPGRHRVDRGWHSTRCDEHVRTRG